MELIVAFWPPALGDGGRRAEPGAELGPASAGRLDPKEPLCERVGSDESGVHSSCDVADARLVDVVLIIGRNRSLVRSKISEPIAPIAEAYLSRRMRDSLTMKSANSLTRSASEAATASFAVKAWKRSMLALANCSAL